jgi:hypothetical protein
VFVEANQGLFEARRNDRWGEARPLPFSGSKDIRDGDPFFSPDGSRLFFWSSRPFPGKTAEDTDVWVVERRADGWGEPRRLEPPVNTEINEPFPAAAADLYVSRWKDGRWSPARNLGPAVNGPDHEFCPQLVDGGRLLLFSRDTPEAGVFQIDASVLDDPATP